MSNTNLLLYSIFLEFFARTSYLSLILGFELSAIAPSIAPLHPTLSQQ